MDVAAVGVAVDRHGVAVDRHDVVVVGVGLSVARSERIDLFWTCAIVVRRHDCSLTAIVNGKSVLAAR